MQIDLHGYTVHQAWSVFSRRVDEAYYAGHKTCKVITGYGQIQSELSVWAYNHPKVNNCKQQNPNRGAFVLQLKKR